MHNLKLYDAFDNPIAHDTLLSVQRLKYPVYVWKEDDELWFKPYDVVEKVSTYFKNDLQVINIQKKSWTENDIIDALNIFTDNTPLEYVKTNIISTLKHITVDNKYLVEIILNECNTPVKCIIL